MKIFVFIKGYFVLCLIVLLLGQTVLGQKDSVVVQGEKPFLPKLLVPTALILSGVLLTDSQTEKNWQIDIRNKVGSDYHNNFDDYAQYIPYAQVYLGDLMGVEAKNHWFDQTKNIFLGGVVTLAVTHALKRGVGKERPDGSSNHSFSSGHTATAFLGGTILYHEYKESSLLYASSGYLFSVSAGSFPGLRASINPTSSF